MYTLQTPPIAPHKIHQKKPAAVRSASFSQVTLNKTDVGEFQGGYFVMTEASKENVLPLPTPPVARSFNRNPKAERPATAERSKSSNDMTRPPPPAHQSPFHQLDNHMSPKSSSAPQSPHKNNRKHSPNTPLQFAVPVTAPAQPKPNQATNTHPAVVRTSPPKGRTSPRKEKAPSPTSNDHWAGAAFSNAPPASSLPMPDFPPFESPPSSTSSSAPSSPHSSPSSSPPLPAALFHPVAAPPVSQSTVVYHETVYYAPVPVYHAAAPLTHPASPQFTYAPPAPSLDQLSMDLRRVLHIGVP